MIPRNNQVNWSSDVRALKITVEDSTVFHSEETSKFSSWCIVFVLTGNIYCSTARRQQLDHATRTKFQPAREKEFFFALYPSLPRRQGTVDTQSLASRNRVNWRSCPLSFWFI